MISYKSNNKNTTSNKTDKTESTSEKGLEKSINKMHKKSIIKKQGRNLTNEGGGGKDRGNEGVGGAALPEVRWTIEN